MIEVNLLRQREKVTGAAVLETLPARADTVPLALSPGRRAASTRLPTRGRGRPASARGTGLPAWWLPPSGSRSRHGGAAGVHRPNAVQRRRIGNQRGAGAI